MNANQEAIVRAVSQQVRNATVWVSNWRQFKDASSVRCAAFALGRVSSLVEFAHSQGAQLPEILKLEVDALGEVHRQL